MASNKAYDCPTLREVSRLLTSRDPLRNLLAKRIRDKLATQGVEEQVNKVIEAFFRGDRPPISILYQFLCNVEGSVADRSLLYDLKIFKDLCIVKSMPTEIHERFVSGFRKKMDKIACETENKELISMQLAAVVMEILPFSDIATTGVLGPAVFGAYALALRGSDWSKSFADRTCDHIFPWGEPPVMGALDTRQLEAFMDALIKDGIMNDTRLKDDLETKIAFVREWLAVEREIDRYYVAILPEANSSLIDAMLADSNLSNLIIVSVPDCTSVPLASIKKSIDDVGNILRKVYNRINS